MTHSPDQVARWHSLADAAELEIAALARILGAASAAAAARRPFRIVLAGGSTPQGVYRRLAQTACDWSHWHIYFGDERCVPAGDSQSNAHMARTDWLDRVAIPTGQVHAIAGELGAQRAAEDYAAVLAGLGPFDMVLLGLGEDGHTASLFPGHDWGDSSAAADVMAVYAAPKPPPERVSLSAQRLARAHEVLFLVAGDGKRDALTRWRRGEDIPARAICPRAGVDVLIAGALAEQTRPTSACPG